MEKLSAPIDSQWPQYPENDAPFRSENFYFFNENLERPQKSVYSQKGEIFYVWTFFSEIWYAEVLWTEKAKNKVRFKVGDK
jgi:hypothetical protein